MNILLVVASICVVIAILRYIWYGVLFLIFGGNPAFNRLIRHIKNRKE